MLVSVHGSVLSLASNASSNYSMVGISLWIRTHFIPTRLETGLTLLVRRFAGLSQHFHHFKEENVSFSGVSYVPVFYFNSFSCSKKKCHQKEAVQRHQFIPKMVRFLLFASSFVNVLFIVYLFPHALLRMRRGYKQR